MGVSQARVSRMEHGDVEKMQVESVAAYIGTSGARTGLGLGQVTQCSSAL